MGENEKAMLLTLYGSDLEFWKFTTRNSAQLWLSATCSRKQRDSIQKTGSISELVDHAGFGNISSLVVEDWISPNGHKRFFAWRDEILRQLKEAIIESER